MIAAGVPLVRQFYTTLFLRFRARCHSPPAPLRKFQRRLSLEFNNFLLPGQALRRVSSQPVFGPAAPDQVITKLEEQNLLLKDPAHVRTVHRRTKVNGERQATTKQQAVRPWWRTDPSGQIVMSIKFGAKPVEFEKGKAGIAIPSKEKLPAVIDTLIAAVKAGEIDELFNQAAKTT
jgi:hypothetical protein